MTQETTNPNFLKHAVQLVREWKGRMALKTGEIRRQAARTSIGLHLETHSCLDRLTSMRSVDRFVRWRHDLPPNTEVSLAQLEECAWKLESSDFFDSQELVRKYMRENPAEVAVQS